MLGTLNKAASVLTLFGDEPEWGVSEVSRELGLPKSSTHSLLTSLAQTGFLERTQDNRYRLGWRLLALSRNFLDSSSLRAHARPTVVALRRRLNVTVNVATLNHGMITYLDSLGGWPVTSMTQPAAGSRVPAHCTALGKALLAFGPPAAVVEAADASHLQRYTSATICRASELNVELKEVRRVGYACDRGEIISGLYCFAAPVLNADGRAVAAISVVVPQGMGLSSHQFLARTVVAASGQTARAMRDVAGPSKPGALSAPGVVRSKMMAGER